MMDHWHGHQLALVTTGHGTRPKLLSIERHGFTQLKKRESRTRGIRVPRLGME
jgi:hypothetical protein